MDTHFHIDHAYGNAALPSTVQIIGSDFTRRMLLSPEARQGVMWIGRAHTAGNVVVYVPSEKAVASGDILFKAQVGWQGDAFPNDHPATLDALKKLDIELLLPGHGDHIAGRANIDAAITAMQGYLREEWRQAADARQQKLSPDDALKKMDLSRSGNPVYPRELSRRGAIQGGPNTPLHMCGSIV